MFRTRQSYSQSSIRDKVKVVLALSNYVTKKRLDHATGGIAALNLVAKNDFIALKVEVDKVNINKLVMFRSN